MSGGFVKSNRRFSGPAIASNDPPPMRRPSRNTSSMKRRIDVTSVTRRVHVVRPRPRRDHEQRQPRAVAASAHRVARLRRDAGEDRRAVATDAVAIERVDRPDRRVDDRAHEVVVPAIGVVPREQHRGVLPLRPALQIVQHPHEKRLLVDRIGVAGVAVLIGRRLEKRHRGEVSGIERREKVGEIVLVVRRVALRPIAASDPGRTCFGLAVDG